MAAFSSPMRFIPPLTPRRAPSPAMSPGGRRGRAYGSSEESRLRDLSPETTLRAFTQKPMPFDTTRDEYNIFACIDTLTAAERDLGARVAKAAQRLKTWCAEIEQWTWTGSFEQPSAEYREQRRRSIELRIREHVADSDLVDDLPPLEYWGSLLSVEVERHDARLDDIEDAMLKLDVEELKEHVLDMHPGSRSRPSSAGYGANANRQDYKIMDDFSFLITQTLLSALPHHAQLKDRLSTWTARVSILREAPRYMADLDTAQKAMRLGWDAIEPPADTSDLAFEQWREAVDTISGVLRDKVSDLGRRLDRMLDTLEGREDCLPDYWIDTFESTEADYGRWTHESRKRVIDLDVQRRAEGYHAGRKGDVDMPTSHSAHVAFNSVIRGHADTANAEIALPTPVAGESIGPARTELPSATAFRSDASNPRIESTDSAVEATSPKAGSAIGAGNPVKLTNYEHPNDAKGDMPTDDHVVNAHANSSKPSTTLVPTRAPGSSQTDTPKVEPLRVIALPPEPINASGDNKSPVTRVLPEELSFESGGSRTDDESEFDEGDTIVHNELEDSGGYVVAQDTSEPLLQDQAQATVDTGLIDDLPNRPRPLALFDPPTITTNDGQDGTVEPPHTPRSWRGSLGSLSTDMSPDSSPHSIIEESPSVRNVTNRAMRAPRPELNAAMAKRRTGKSAVTDDTASAPWPPTRFTQKPTSSAEELERKISDILTTIPAHIRLTSGPGPDAPEVKPIRGIATKGSRGYLRAARSASGLKSPELTLSPAKSEFDSNNAASGRKSAAAQRGDNDIKLYHLTQPGKEQPIKLFIRRVGENGERVMVRVGGGWSDLGEYLRQYAEHHGRRTASEGKFEILGLEVKNPDSSPIRPESGMSKRDRRLSGGHSLASPATTPIKSSGLGISSDEAPPPMPSFTSTTPGIAEEPSMPSTTSSRNSWQGNEVGLAGPKAKKLDLSGEKLEWIEGMMKQARTVSGNVITANQTPFPRDERDERSESRPDSRTSTRPAAAGRKSDFGDLGKVGATKRIFLKGGKPTLGDH
ncbi:hypothetical protein BDW02DRAFT_571896 [Decorospora gaudefroyi]|uniref:GAR domain-containing protein n=1 Tax=Decorospora gaudefroyi TaxID=184978 RepID=A0A6A5KDX1_9PLEO|nr:hypothetical protein BDW02DRAFT_571896 [Decorospora gaudefroyi]